MKNKAQRQFLKERQAYEKQLRKKALEDNLSLSEKLEWQQLNRNKYRENLFTAERIRRHGLLPEFLSPKLLIIILIIGSLVWPIILTYIPYVNGDHEIISINDDNFYADDYLYDEEDSLITEPYEAVSYLESVGNSLYTLYTEAQEDYESSSKFDISYLHQLDVFTYVYFDFINDDLYDSLQTLHNDILALAKLEYSDLPIKQSELDAKKAQIEASKHAFDDQIAVSLANPSPDI